MITGFGRLPDAASPSTHDFTVIGGSFSEVQSNKISASSTCDRGGIPVIGLNDSGARVQEGVGRWPRTVRCSCGTSRRPVYTADIDHHGPVRGRGVYSPLTDVRSWLRDFNMFLTVPTDPTVTGERSPLRNWAGVVHNSSSGVAQLMADNEEDALRLAKTLLSYLPQNNTEDPPALEPYDPIDRMDESLNSIVPTDESASYDMRDVLASIFDHESIFELHPDFAANALVGFARLDGQSVGFVANQPIVMSGCLDIDSSDKISRHVTLCDQFNIPLITFVDCPGYLPGIEQEYRGVIRHGAKIIYAYCQATVPMISIVTRKAIGGSYVAMSSKQMNNDVAFAWPTAQIAMMGAEGAAELLHKDAIRAAADPEAEHARFVAEFKEKFTTRTRRPTSASRRGHRAARPGRG